MIFENIIIYREFYSRCERLKTAESKMKALQRYISTRENFV